MNKELLKDPSLTVADRSNLEEIIADLEVTIESGDVGEMEKRLDSLINLRATLDVAGKDLVDFGEDVQAADEPDEDLKRAIEMMFDSNRSFRDTTSQLIALLEERVV